MPLPTTREISLFLDQTLEVNTYSDAATNGLQIESPQQSVSKIGFAVDSGLSIIQRAAALGCDMLVVHHGVLWGGCEPLTGPFGRKVNLCMVGGLSLYASHLPLDGHLEYGNGAQIAKKLGLRDMRGFASYGGRTIGVRGTLPEQIPIDVLAEKVGALCGNDVKPLVLPFGKRSISSVAIVTGSGSSTLAECASSGIDVLISGEPKQEVYHRAKELECSAIFAGHYATETFGVRALERVLAEHFRVETEWIDEPTGI
jgi:dinuclear metal center YbgI/SA1388 family protein